MMTISELVNKAVEIDKAVIKATSDEAAAAHSVMSDFMVRRRKTVSLKDVE